MSEQRFRGPDMAQWRLRGGVWEVLRGVNGWYDWVAADPPEGLRPA